MRQLTQWCHTSPRNDVTDLPARSVSDHPGSYTLNACLAFDIRLARAENRSEIACGHWLSDVNCTHFGRLGEWLAGQGMVLAMRARFWPMSGPDAR